MSDELDRIVAADIGGVRESFGFPADDIDFTTGGSGAGARILESREVIACSGGLVAWGRRSRAGESDLWASSWGARLQAQADSRFHLEGSTYVSVMPSSPAALFGDFFANCWQHSQKALCHARSGGFEVWRIKVWNEEAFHSRVTVGTETA